MTQAEMHAGEDGRGFDDFLISFLGGLVMGGIVWAILLGLVKAIKDAAPPGINLDQLISKVQITLPPSIDLSKITIVIPPPSNEPWITIVYVAFIAVPILGGLGAWVYFYRKLMRME